jgi:hypothetical protein
MWTTYIWFKIGSNDGPFSIYKNGQKTKKIGDEET